MTEVASVACCCCCKSPAPPNEIFGCYPTQVKISRGVHLWMRFSQTIRYWWYDDLKQEDRLLRWCITPRGVFNPRRSHWYRMLSIETEYTIHHVHMWTSRYILYFIDGQSSQIPSSISMRLTASKKKLHFILFPKKQNKTKWKNGILDTNNNIWG